ncbi:MAG: hypothetical protein H6Q34_974 [Deltaproteobacteria bacterium]|nr:hypothetical protein [Deltaproteobacteria bacterium]
MNETGLRDQLFLALGIIGIRHTAIDRADCGTLLLIEETDALSALLRHDVIDVPSDRGVFLSIVLPLSAAFVDRRIRALWLTRAAVDAFFRNYRGHRDSSELRLNDAATANMSAANGKVEKSVRAYAVSSAVEGGHHLLRDIGECSRHGMCRLIYDQRRTSIHACAQLAHERDLAE